MSALDSEGPDWDSIRDLYENELKVTTRMIFVRFGITKHALQKRIVAEGWMQRGKGRKGVSRSRLLTRMLEAIDRQLAEIETDEKIPIERKVTMMAGLSRTLAKVLQMEKERRKGSKTKDASEELLALREKIAKRIEQLNQG